MHKMNSDKKQSFLKKIIFSWISWFIILGLVMMIVYGYVQHIYNMNQPSEEWSIGIQITNDAPNDYRKIGQTTRPNDKGIAVAYVIEEGIRIHELDWLGNIERSFTIEMDSSHIKVLKLSFEKNLYNIYFSDRKTLDRLTIDIETFSVNDKKRISNTAEQFDLIGRTVIAGDDNITQVIDNEEVVAAFKDYDNLKRVSITRSGEKIFATMDTFDGGGSLIVVDGNNVTKRNIKSSFEQNIYGYLEDIYVEDGVIAIASRRFNRIERTPTAIGMWQIDEKNLNTISFEIFYHVRTSLLPQITHVSGNTVRYLLGNQQRLDRNNSNLSYTGGGMFTNISHYTREGNRLVENTRLTVTRRYPSGYDYYKTNEGEVIVWADREGENSNIVLAGKGDKWIIHAKDSYRANYGELIIQTLFAFGSTIVHGTLVTIASYGMYWKWLLGFIILAIIYYKLSPFDEDKTILHIFICLVTLIIGIEFYMTGIANLQFKRFVNIYPILFGNDFLLGTISLITSLCAVGLYIMWSRKHYYIRSKFLHFIIFFCFQLYFYLFSIMVYFVSSSMKINFMV